MGTPCAKCGSELNHDARVCPQCGTPVAAPMPTAAQTMIGFSSPFAPAPQQPAPAPAPAPTPQSAPMAQTMLGFAAPDLRVPPQPSAPAPAPIPTGAKTMLGVAAPGIAPLAASAPQPAPPQPQAPASLGGTMLGVAMPGIAPLHSQPGVAPPPAQPAPIGGRTMLLEQPPPIVPAPAPLVHEAAPSAPVVVAKRGAPLAVVAIVASILVLGGGVALLLFSRGAPPLTATAKVSADGKEQLHLSCESCPDGTKASLHGATATFAHHEADLDLPAPLVIGQNKFDVALDRPGVGRDETVKIVLPLAYRIRADLSSLAATPPLVKVDVEAQPGEAITVDGKPVALDASGKATLSYDVTTDTTGAADETKTIERKIPYEAVGKDKKKSTGEVLVRVAVVSLHIDAPGPNLVTGESKVWVAGKTAKGATVTANGASLAVGPDGSFEGQVDVQDGTQTIAIRAAAAGDAATKAAPRTTSVTVKRTPSLDDEAKALEKSPSIGADALARDPAASLGQPVAVHGAVIDARTTHHRTALLVDDKDGCATGPCMVRVDYGGDLDVKAGDTVAAYGAVAKPITTPEGKALPAIDASLVHKSSKKGKR